MNKFTYMTDTDFSEGRHYIGASDVPTLALLNVKYGQTPLTLWQEKTGRAEGFQGNERSKAGKELEPLVLKWGLEKLEPFSGFNLDFFNVFMASYYRNYLEPRLKPDLKLHSLTECRHPNYNFICSHADLICSESPLIMEGKTTGFFGAKRTNDINKGYDKDDMSANGIPSSVYIQLQTQMLCYDIKTAYVSVMIDTGIHRLYGPVKAHKKTQEAILALCERFWWNVEHDTPPKPETWKDIIILNPNLDKESKVVIGGDDELKVLQMKKRSESLKKRKKGIDSELKDIKNAIGLIMGENAYLESSDGKSLAKAFEVVKYNLKDYKLMRKQRFNKMLADGFINKSEYRDMRY